jgi:uncharacterized protein (DUF2062 family)
VTRPAYTVSQRVRRWFRYLYLRLVRVSGDPVHVALGFSLGVFLGVFPTFGIGIPLALGLATLFRWNRAAALLGSLVMNPVTTPFFWSLSAAAGALLFGLDRETVLAFAAGKGRGEIFSEMALVYLAGNVVVALATSALAYALALRAVRLYREERERRLARRR